MGRINVLDKHVAELIAAGEVVERPSSVIKELVENAIDAGSDSITVEIKNGGTSYMRVTDNGCGIMREDVRTAFLRHATSKVRSQNDLDSIGTLGFRGEALASVCAVAEVELLTRSADEEIGTSYKISGGEEIGLFDAGCPAGTTIIVRNLFYNVPARMKFLKKDVAEGNSVSAVMDKIALSHPEISFEYIRDGRQMFKTAGDSNLKSASYTVYGRDFVSTLIPVNYELNGVRVAGYVSRPEGARPNRNMQNFFINGRYIKSRTASAALEEASKGSVMVGKFLACVLHITIPAEMVDVNVHPAKIEVRFISERPIFDSVYYAVQSALMQGDERKQVKFPAREIPAAAEPAKTPSYRPIPPKNEKEEIKAWGSLLHTVLRDGGSQRLPEPEPIPDMPPLPPEPEKTSEKRMKEMPPADTQTEAEKPLTEITEHTFRYIGEAFKTYIIIEKNGSELVIIDKHAAHERMIYEKLKNGGAQIYEQGLLAPIPVTLNKTDYNSVIENLDVFKKIYFEVEDFGSGTVLVRSAPQFLEKADIAATVMEIAGFLTENRRDLSTEKMDWIFHSLSCRSAVKAGNINSDAELIELARRVEADPSLRYCPHGRPICIVLTKSELEKQFGRE